MGWSEQYWEDVRSELEQPATKKQPPGETDSPATAEDGDLRHPIPDRHVDAHENAQ